MPVPYPSSSPRNGPIRVVSADPQPLFRDALARAIREDRGLELVAEARDAGQLAAAIQQLAPDVAVVEADMIEPLPPDWDVGSTRLLLLAAEVSPIEAYDAVASGAAGYLSKDAESPAIRRAIAAVARGETVLDRSAQTGIASEIRVRARDDRPELSAREQEILVLIAEGRTAPQIARQLHLSTATVKTHLLDRRSNLLSLEPATLEKAAALYAPLVADLDAAVDRPSDAERVIVIRFLERAAELTERHAEMLAAQATAGRTRPVAPPAPGLWA